MRKIKYEWVIQDLEDENYLFLIHNYQELKYENEILKKKPNEEWIGKEGEGRRWQVKKGWRKFSQTVVHCDIRTQKCCKLC